MTDETPPDDPTKDGEESPPKAPPAKLTASLLDEERFPARDADFDGANDEAMAIKLATLEEEHRDLDAAIKALEQNSPYERLTIARLKKKKLQLKDAIQKAKAQRASEPPGAGPGCRPARSPRVRLGGGPGSLC